MPNLQIIKDLSHKKKVTIRKIAEAAGVTEAGLHGAIDRGDIKFSYLDRIANYLKVNLSVFSDFSSTKTESSISVGDNNSSNVATGNIVQVTIPEEGKQKIIKPDGTVKIEAISPHENGDHNESNQSDKETIKLQTQLIQSLQDQIEMYKKVIGHS
ncbi:MAG: hypothetical protein E6772_16830 [Dysgonomonas sp.]|nr:hypothetical protein [Dysgonomonas sp.]